MGEVRVSGEKEAGWGARGGRGRVGKRGAGAEGRRAPEALLRMCKPASSRKHCSDCGALGTFDAEMREGVKRPVNPPPPPLHV